ncbi:MAG: hypothetical protein LUD47_05420 [Clostridia bacterium]|nr:hypothetical protein [Clostridia bacterium]
MILSVRVGGCMFYSDGIEFKLVPREDVRRFGDNVLHVGDFVALKSVLDEADSVVSVYKDGFAMGSYAVVVILCDTEGPPCDDFRRIRKSIADVYGQRICDRILFFVNPCVMRVTASHGSDVRLWAMGNREHQPETEKFCGEKNHGK